LASPRRLDDAQAGHLSEQLPIHSQFGQKYAHARGICCIAMNFIVSPDSVVALYRNVSYK
jgi:hypothetical protein